MNTRLKWMLVAAVSALSVGAARAAAPADTDYDRDVITVVTLARHSAYPSASCMVWANAEGLGVGPAQLDGMHGVSFNINLTQMPDEAAKQPTTFAQGLAAMKARFPAAPAWMTAALEKHRAAIEAACAKDQPTPIKIYSLTQKDKAG